MRCGNITRSRMSYGEGAVLNWLFPSRRRMMLLPPVHKLSLLALLHTQVWLLTSNLCLVEVGLV